VAQSWEHHGVPRWWTATSCGSVGGRTGSSFEDCRSGINNYGGPLSTLTPWSSVLFEKLTVPQLFKKSPSSYRPQRLIAAFTTARNLSLLWFIWIQSTTFTTTHFSTHFIIGRRDSFWRLNMYGMLEIFFFFMIPIMQFIIESIMTTATKLIKTKNSYA
jgi:hypothetical protein